MAVDPRTGYRVPPPPYAARALVLWPRLDATQLRRTKGDPGRIARLIERRTTIPREQILKLLGAPRES
jgi:hypothetical protein